MKKFIVLVLAVLSMSAVALSQTPDPIMRDWVRMKAYLDATYGTLADPTFVTPTLRDAILLYNIYATPRAQSVTNAQAVVCNASKIVLTGIGSAADGTNTVTLPTPIAAGQTVDLIVDSSSTNLVSIVAAANVVLSATWLGNTNDVLSLYAVSSSKWIELSRGNNP
jgi:hypothetical protein